MPSATSVRMRIEVAIAPSGPIQPSAPVYGPRRTGSSPRRISMARIFGAPVIDPPGKAAASRSNGSRPWSSRPVTVETRCWTATVRSSRQRRGTRTVPGTADAAEVVAEDVDDHHVLGAVLLRAKQLAGEGPVLVARPAARPRALDRVGRDAAVRRSIARNGSGEAERIARGRAGALPAPSRDPARRCRGRDTPRTGTGRRSGGGGTAATGRRRTASRAAA